MRRPVYNETVQFRAPDGVGAALEVAARKDLTSVSEWLRRTTLQKLREMGIDPGDDAGAVQAI